MIRNIAVLGAGTMGSSVAENFAIYGYKVNLFDIDKNSLDLAKDEIKKDLELLKQEDLFEDRSISEVLNNIQYFTDIESAVKDCDFITESIPENLELKQNTFKSLDNICPPETIFASNTSTLRLNDMMSLVSDSRKKRMMITHYYNPAHIMPIVELSSFDNLSEEVYREVEQLFESINKQPVKVKKDVSGLVANRIQMALAREVFSIIENDIADPADIEKALKFGPAFRYATTGQLEVSDMGGLDIWKISADNLLPDLSNGTETNALLKEKVQNGKLGVKSGEGFFKYDAEAIERDKFKKRLIHQLKASKYYM